MQKESKTIEEYKREMHSMQLWGNVFGFVCNIIILFIVVCMGLSLLTMFIDKRNQSHTPVETSMLTADASKIPSKQYNTSVQNGYTKNGIKYMKITIGGYSTTRSENQLAVLGDDTACDSEIYTLTIHNEDKFFLKITIPNSITIVRYSVFGEKDFSKKEIKEYKEKAAEYFTHEKYARMRYDDANDYNTEIENMAQ